MATKKKAKTKKGGDLVEVWRLAAAAWWASIGAKTEDDGPRRFVVSHGWQEHRRDKTRMVTITPPPDWVAPGKALAAATAELIGPIQRAGLDAAPATQLTNDLEESPSIPTVEMIDASRETARLVSSLQEKKKSNALPTVATNAKPIRPVLSDHRKVLRVLRRDGGDYGLLLRDIMVPGIMGKKLQRRLDVLRENGRVELVHRSRRWRAIGQ